MAFKNTYKISGIEWCFSRDKADERGLAAKYRKGVQVRLVPNKHNPENVNVFAERQFIGFINNPESAQILDALDNSVEIFAKIHSVVGASEESPAPESVQIEASTYPRRLRGVKGVVKSGYAEPNNKIDRGNLAEQSRRLDAPIDHAHRIAGKKFKAQIKKEHVISEHAGKMGIYCIWGKTHETYVGQSVDIGRRIYQHYEALENGAHPNSRLQADWSLGHARFRFDVVELVKHRGDLDHREEYYISTYQTYLYGYNSTPDGQGKTPKDGAVYENVDVSESAVDEGKIHQCEPAPRSTARTINPESKTGKQNAVSRPAAVDALSTAKIQHFKTNRHNFVELFDGRYMADSFHRKDECEYSYRLKAVASFTAEAGSISLRPIAVAIPP